ncbi:MAG: MFS transporter [Planctomycetota bacterium]|jgi:FSR family fosmidomycin resistance protein-like MFS transporter
MDAAQCAHRTQWTQLLALTAVHFVIDMFPGFMHPLMPAFQESFQLSAAAGSALLTIFLVAANGIQVLIGHIRSDEDKPLMLYGGLLLVSAIAMFAVIPPGGLALLWLSLIAVISGLGVGMTHPEMLRAIHRMDHISSAASSTVFMAGGVVGFAFSGWVSTHLFELWGMNCVYPFCLVAIVTLLVLPIFRIRLAVERDESQRKTVRTEAVSFWLIMVMATLGACSAQVLAWIVPYRIKELGLDLTFGGEAVSVYSLAGGVGGIVFSFFVKRFGELRLIRWMLAAGVPFMLAYLVFLPQRWSPLLIFGGGFFCFGAYPLMVSLARHCEGPNLGQRMGLIVGGIWLVACLLPMLLGWIIDIFGTVPILFCVPVGFMLALLLSLKRQQ